MRCLSLATLLAAMLALSGCVGPGETTVTFERGKPTAPLTLATRRATYALYAAHDEADVLQKVDLSPGDRYGFVRKSDDSIVATAGGQEFPLGGRLVEFYYWKAYADRP